MKLNWAGTNPKEERQTARNEVHPHLIVGESHILRPHYHSEKSFSHVFRGTKMFSSEENGSQSSSIFHLQHTDTPLSAIKNPVHLDKIREYLQRKEVRFRGPSLSDVLVLIHISCVACKIQGHPFIK
ncbi:hypothetical protein PROFUN_08749 [Planoprotostelium fungivorum]|uniref:Uncharacterized protein n=1 Tax=Planoprotostelium fungivorum TaxID=1890364 RepID=A0A2P6ND86_9EUKA|nr:hypothetical protein PROFUN_08749 [Planoprotostelium fungivorum]